MSINVSVGKAEQDRALWLSTIAFTVCFAVWTIFAIIGLRIKSELGLSDFEFGVLVGTPILTGSLSRLVLGVWADQRGGRFVMFVSMLMGAAATFLLTFAYDYPTFLLAALGIGVAGGSFPAGVTYVSKFFPPEKQGTALGIFGAGNVGAAVTKLLAPMVMVAYGWEAVAQIWALALVVLAFVFYAFTKDDPDLIRRRAEGCQAEPLSAMLVPLRNLQVWRFSLYYFFVFGGFVALALWLPHYYVEVYGLDIVTAGALAAAYSIPGSIFRIVGGRYADTHGARKVMYWALIGSVACTFVLSYPATRYVVQGVDGPIAFSLALGFVPFTVIAFALGFFMSLGKAAIYKHIPHYYPDRVGVVGGVVGLIGGLGGFVIPIAFGIMNDLLGVWTSCFMLLFVISAVSLTWMHFAIRAMDKKAHPELDRPQYLPELEALRAELETLRKASDAAPARRPVGRSAAPAPAE
ncbi:MFS transporter [Salinarimonas ramus]|uniref:MFS transporter n=2 Tax=Salinarimonas ramus TaxID=690164 RepID=A0A917QHT6_9HYPH|nr:MFS transporter [Salinarimonas ramus]